MDPPQIPRKFQERITPNDTTNTIKKKKELEAIKLQHHVFDLKDQTLLHRDRLSMEDQEALLYIDSLPTNLANILKGEWTSNVQKEELTSVQIWSRKRLFSPPPNLTTLNQVPTTGRLSNHAVNTAQHHATHHATRHATHLELPYPTNAPRFFITSAIPHPDYDTTALHFKSYTTILYHTTAATQLIHTDEDNIHKQAG